MDRLKVGEKLNNGEKLTSPNGKYELRMQTDGNLVLYDAGKPVWAANTKDSGADYLEVQADGNVVLYKKSGLFNRSEKPVWASNTRPNQDVSLMLQDDRNLVITPAGGSPVWTSQTMIAAPTTTTTTVTAAEKAANMPAAPRPAAPQAAPAAKNASVAKTAPAAKAANARTYKVAKGESLWKIAERFYGDPMEYKKIAKANNISNPNLIRIGQELIIPD